MATIYFDNKTYDNFDALNDMMDKEFMGTLVYDELLNEGDEYGLYDIGEAIEALHESFDYKGRYKAVHFYVKFYMDEDAHIFPKLEEVIEVIHLIRDYYCDYQMGYGIFNERSSLTIHFILNPMHIDTGEMRMVDRKDMVQICHLSRINRLSSPV